MYALHGEGEYVIPLLLFVPNGGTKYPGLIYLHPKGKIADATVGGRIEQLVKSGYLVAAPDLIGTGETAGRGSVAMLIGRSVAGIQAGDVVRVVNFLKARNDIDVNKIGGLAFDEMCPVLLHAGTFEKSINSISLIGSLISYKSVVLNKFYDQTFCSNYVAGAITAYDLPDLVGCIAPRKICLAGLNDQQKNIAPAEMIDEDLRFPQQVFSGMNSSGNINIVPFSGDVNSIVSWCFK